MKKLMNKQILFSFAIIAAAAMMMTSQMPEAYAANQICLNQTFDSSSIIKKKTNIIVQTDPDGGFNVCILDGLSLKQGNIIVEENAVVIITGGTNIKGGNIELQGNFAAVNFERSDPILGLPQNFLDGNIFGGDNTYIFLDDVTINGNIVTSGEVYISSQENRFTGPTVVDGNISVQANLNNDNEFVMAGGEVTGSVTLNTLLTIHVFDATIGGNLQILDNVNTSPDGSIIIENNQIGSTLKLQRNTMTTVLLKDNTVNGGLNIQDNPSDIELDGNTIAANASCKGNDSVFGNTIFNGKGKKQCEQLNA